MDAGTEHFETDIFAGPDRFYLLHLKSRKGRARKGGKRKISFHAVHPMRQAQRALHTSGIESSYSQYTILGVLSPFTDGKTKP